MPPRGVYKARQESRNRPSRPSRPAQESRSDQREQERQERENARKALAQSKERARVALRKSQVQALASAKAKQANEAEKAKKAQQAKQAQSAKRDPRDNQSQPSGTSAKQRATKINNAVKTTTTKSKMSPPLSKPKSPTKFTIKGGTIKGGTIYKDPITGSTLAGRDTRMKAITDPSSVRVQSSRDARTAGPKGFTRKGSLIDMTPDTAGPKGFTRKGLTPFQEKQAGIINNMSNPQETKLDLVTKEPVQNTLLTELSKRRKKRQGSGFTGIMSQIRSLLG